MSLSIKTVCVAGAGTMGSGIAQVMAQSGYKTVLFDISNEMLNKAKTDIGNALKKLVEKQKITTQQMTATLGNISFTDKINDIKGELIIEAIVEKLSVKKDFFISVSKNNSHQTILATNTSSIPVTQIAAGIQNPERVIGIHFFNPAPVMKLVEIISGPETDDQIALGCKNFIGSLGKTCVTATDSPGFIVNRVARHYYVEALKIAEENVADFETIDALMENNGFKMGPFRLMDLIGVDTNFSVTNSIYNLFHQDGKFRPNRIQQKMVDAGYHGRKTKKGFYNYE